ncbi:hypothetical protein WME94_17040 [Sorangium sp. So ce429]
MYFRRTTIQLLRVKTTGDSTLRTGRDIPSSPTPAGAAGVYI